MRQRKHKHDSSTDPAKVLSALEAKWRLHAEEWQAKLDRGESLTVDEKLLFRGMLEAWSSFGVIEAEQRSPAETEEFKRNWNARVRAWEDKEKRDELYTLEEFKEQARVLGHWFVIGKVESEAMTDEQLATGEGEHKEEVERRSPPDRTRPAFTYASERLCGMDYLAIPIRQRQREEWWQGFWQTFMERGQARHSRLQKEFEEKATRALVPWKGLTPADYEFHKWAGSKDDNELQLAAFYEYARESQKLRGLLSMRLFGSKKRKGLIVPCFDGLHEYQAQKALGRWFVVLEGLAKELVENVPFTAIQPARIEQALYHTVNAGGRTRRLWCRLDDEIAGYFWYEPAVSLAFRIYKEGATDFETALDDPQRRGSRSKYRKVRSRERVWLKDHRRQLYAEVMTVKIDWKHYADSELAESFKQFLARYRPKKFPEPKTRRRQGKAKVSRRAFFEALDNLAALRLLTHCANEDAAHQRFKGIKSNPSRRDNFKAQGKGAREKFSKSFPFGEKAANHGFWK